jgi:hypothetical protein
MRFSKKYKSFNQWFLAKERKSRYAKRVIRLHKFLPKLNLNTLRNLKEVDYDLSKKSWVSLSSIEKNKRILSVEALRSLRKKDSFKEILKKVGLKKTELIKNLGRFIKKKGRKWKVSPTDNIEIEMLFYEKDVGVNTIVTKSSKDRSLIGGYFANVKLALENKSNSVLRKFEKIGIIDANGEMHYFETNLEYIIEINDSIEEPEYQTIY